MLRHWLSACLFWCFGCAAAVAQTGLSPMLGVASSFGQSWYPDLLSSAEAIPVRTFRDEMYWERIEDLGQYQFSQFMTTYPHMIGAKGNEVLFPRIHNGLGPTQPPLMNLCSTSLPWYCAAHKEEPTEHRRNAAGACPAGECGGN